MRSILRSGVATAIAMAATAGLHAQTGTVKAGHWIGSATYKDQQVPAMLDLSAAGSGGSVSGAFINGDEVEPASSGTENNGHLVLNFADYARKLEGDISGGVFHGTLNGARIKTPIPIDLRPDREGKPATRFVAGSLTGTAKGTVNGEWEIAVGTSAKGEAAWSMDVTPFGGNGEIKAVIQRIDGDTGGLYGGFDTSSGAYRVGHVGAFGLELYSLKPQPDGTLLVTNLLRANSAGDTSWTARRQEVARAEKLPPPTLSTEQTTVVDPSKPFQFSEPNLAGVTISNTDPQFKDKVVIVAIGGSWCPNCHDEAPFLVELYNRFHAQGLEIVNLSFEEADQLKNPERLRAFIDRYHIPYTVLVAGTPDDLATVVPQGKNLNSWPTSFFIGRDGLVKETHSGFSGPATGQANVELKAEVTALVEKLLAQKNVASR